MEIETLCFYLVMDWHDLSFRSNSHPTNGQTWTVNPKGRDNSSLHHVNWGEPLRLRSLGASQLLIKFELQIKEPASPLMESELSIVYGSFLLLVDPELVRVWLTPQSLKVQPYLNFQTLIQYAALSEGQSTSGWACGPTHIVNKPPIELVLNLFFRWIWLRSAFVLGWI